MAFPDYRWAMSTIPAMLRAKFDRARDRPYARVKVAGDWNQTTGRDCETNVLAAAALLDKMGIEAGDRVAILGPPHPNWTSLDFAVLCRGGVTVGIYPTLTPDQVAWQLRHSGAKALFVDSEATLDRLAAIEVPELRFRSTWELPAEQADSEAFWRRAAEVKPEDPCAIVYTSGTTGDPKGAVLTHRAIHAVSVTSREVVPLAEGDRSLVFLPLAHVLQRITVYRGLLEDVEAWFCPRIEDFLDVVKEARPSVLASVPRMLEKIKARVEGQVAQASPLRQRIFAAAMATGRERSECLEAGRVPSWWLATRWRCYDRLVYRKVRAVFGGELRMFVCGGARLDPEVARFFHALGVDVMEGWGLTETAAPATLNRPGQFRFGTVGKPLPGTEVRIAADGEVETRGPGLFSGYWNNPAATADSFSPDGWYRTGDIGVVDDDGFLRITDRKKEIIITAGGKKIPPVNLEKPLEGGPVGQAIVVGEGRPFLVALFAPDPEHGTEGRDAVASDRLARLNATLAPFEQVKKWAWLPRPLSVDDGTLTPTMKLKRRVIGETYRDVIEGLYAG